MAHIKPDRIFSFKSNIEFKISSNNWVVKASASINPIYPPGTKNLVFLVVYYEVEPHIVPNGITFNAELITPFDISEASDVTIEDLFYCVDKTREQFQNIFDAIFSPISLTVPPIEFEVMKPELIYHLNDIQKELGKQ